MKITKRPIYQYQKGVILSCFLLVIFISIQVILKCCYELNILGIDMSSKSSDMLHVRNK